MNNRCHLLEVDVKVTVDFWSDTYHNIFPGSPRFPCFYELVSRNQFAKSPRELMIHPGFGGKHTRLAGQAGCTQTPTSCSEML